jgi:hypothetical protein
MTGDWGLGNCLPYAVPKHRVEVPKHRVEVLKYRVDFCCDSSARGMRRVYCRQFHYTDQEKYNTRIQITFYFHTFPFSFYPPPLLKFSIVNM